MVYTCTSHWDSVIDSRVPVILKYWVPRVVQVEMTESSRVPRVLEPKMTESSRVPRVLEPKMTGTRFYWYSDDLCISFINPIKVWCGRVEVREGELEKLRCKRTRGGNAFWMTPLRDKNEGTYWGGKESTPPVTTACPAGRWVWNLQPTSESEKQ